MAFQNPIATIHHVNRLHPGGLLLQWFLECTTDQLLFGATLVLLCCAFALALRPHQIAVGLVWPSTELRE